MNCCTLATQKFPKSKAYFASDAGFSAFSGVTVAVATMAPRLAALVLPARVAGLRYLVVVQGGGCDEAGELFAGRKDVDVLHCTGMGLSRSRNLALQHAPGRFVLFADDDMDLFADRILELAGVMDRNSGLDFVAGWRKGRLPRTGARAGEHRLTHFNTGRVCAPEFMLRSDRVRTRGVLFDEAFGVGAGVPLGEDYVFVTDMLKAGLKGAGVPIVTGAHRGPSSGDMWDRPLDRAAVLTRVFGPLSGPVRLVYAIRHRRALGSVRAFAGFAFRRFRRKNRVQ